MIFSGIAQLVSCDGFIRRRLRVRVSLPPLWDDAVWGYFKWTRWTRFDSVDGQLFVECNGSTAGIKKPQAIISFHNFAPTSETGPDSSKIGGEGLTPSRGT